MNIKKNGLLLIAFLSLPHNTVVYSMEVQTKLLRAAEEGNLKQVRKFIAAGYDVDEQNGLGFTPLHLAIAHSRVDIVRELISAGASLELQDVSGRNPIAFAEFLEEKEIVALFREAQIKTFQQSMDRFIKKSSRSQACKQMLDRFAEEASEPKGQQGLEMYQSSVSVDLQQSDDAGYVDVKNQKDLGDQENQARIFEQAFYGQEENAMDGLLCTIL